jgi:hypothetical protein
MDFKLGVLLEQWYAAKQEAAEAQKKIERERELRAAVFSLAFPSPKEGTNSLDIGSGYTLKATYKLDRKVDDEAAQALIAEQAWTGNFFKWKADLNVKKYKELPEEQRLVLDAVLTVKPASPTIEVTAPKEKK